MVAIRQALLRASFSSFQERFMAAIPATVTSTPEGFQPAFQRVQQGGDFDCAFACIAMIAGKTFDEVRDVAIKKFKHPAKGPYWITETLIASLLAHYGYVATVYKEFESFSGLPDVALLLVEYDADLEIGRHVLYHRANASHDEKLKLQYVIDPAYWISQKDHVRTSMPPAVCFIGVHAMQKAEKAGK
jgi:hypothetical protein